MPARSSKKRAPSKLFLGTEPPWQQLRANSVDIKALLTPMLAHTFAELEVSASLWLGKDVWFPIHFTRNLTDFESQFGVVPKRWAYNRRSWARVAREGKALVGEHLGLCDLFVPIFDGKELWAMLVAGPFSKARPASAEVLERWREISGSQGRITDPLFSNFLQESLGVLTLEGNSVASFAQLLGCFSDLVSGTRPADEIAASAEALRRELLGVRFPERMWDATQRLITQSARGELNVELPKLGVLNLPEHVIAGLLRGRKDDVDPVDDLVRRDAFQRACVALARRSGNVACAKLGHHGVVLIADSEGSAARTRARLGELSTRLVATGRRMGLDVFIGIAQARDSSPLSARYRSALSLAEQALSSERRVVFDEPLPTQSSDERWKLRAELGMSSREDPRKLAPRFDRYVQAVLSWSGYRLERTRAELEAGIERLAGPLLASGFLDQKSFDELFAVAAQRGEDAETVTELVLAYRRLVTDMEDALLDPVTARQDRGTRRALAFIREHLSEPLTLPQVARVAGFAPDYFGRLFAREEGTSFTDYVRRHRVDRAKQLIRGTRMHMEQIQKLCGFGARTYFHQVFKRETGMTPLEFRERR